MGNIRKQSIVSTILIYIGFLIGFLNVYLFTRHGSFTEDQYGLTSLFIAIASVMFGFSNMGMLSAVYKFYPYYRDNLPARRIDLLSWALLICLAGFALVSVGGYLFRDLVIRKYSENSALLVTYYFWIFPLGLGLTIFSLFEAFAWSVHRSIVSNLLRETIFRLLITLLIVFYLTGVVQSFDGFIKLYSLLYGAIALMLIGYLWWKGDLHFSFTVSKVTRRFKKKIFSLAAFVYFGTLVYISAQFIDSIIIGSLVSLGMVGVFNFASIISGIVQVPQRGIVSASVAILSQSWKDKDLANIRRIYQRSSINLLLAALGLFALIWLNFTDVILSFGIKPLYLEARWVFFCLGIARIIDMGTGVNGQIISTSNHWKFEFICGVLLLLLMAPLTYFLVREMGIIGAGISNIISFAMYNAIRVAFLYHRYRMQPFTSRTLLALAVTAAAYGISYWLFREQQGIWAMAGRSALFLALFITAIFGLRITPDAMQLYYVARERMKRRETI